MAVLLERGAPLDIQNKKGWTALMWAAKSRHPAIIRLLLDAGAAIDVATKDGRTALHFAAGASRTMLAEASGEASGEASEEVVMPTWAPAGAVVRQLPTSVCRTFLTCPTRAPVSCTLPPCTRRASCTTVHAPCLSDADWCFCYPMVCPIN